MTWKRVSLHRNGSEASLRAELADPLWLLGVQSRLSELKGEDSSAPRLAEVTLESCAVEAEGSIPVEVAQRVRSWPSWASAAVANRAGALLLRLFRAAGGSEAGVKTLKSVWPARSIPVDAKERTCADDLALLTLQRADTLDGLSAYSTSTTKLQQIGDSMTATSDRAALNAALASWRETVASDLSTTSTTKWSSTQLVPPWPNAKLRTQQSTYALHATATDAHNWTAWTLQGQVANAIVQPMESVYISPLRWPGQPARRWWELEPEGVDLAVLGADSTPLRRLLVNLLLGGSDDWFTVVVPAPAGSFCRVSRMSVRDSFGLRVNVKSAAAQSSPAGKKAWRFLELDSGTSASSGPWVPSPSALEPSRPGAVVEQVTLTGDPAQCPVWGRERVVQGGRGAAFDRGKVSAAPTQPPTEDSWALLMDPPNGCVPFVQSRDPLKLLRARLPGVQKAAQGRLLGADGLTQPSVSAWPTEGATLSLRWRQARGADGMLWVWLAQEQGQGPIDEGEIALRWDAWLEAAPLHSQDVSASP